MTEADNKQHIRNQCRQARQKLSTQQQHHYAQAILEKLISLSAYQNSKQIGSYLPTDNEVNTTAIHQHCWQEQKNLLLPSVKNPKSLTFVSYTPTTTLLKNKYGISEPEISTHTPHITREEIDCLLIPLVGFDETGNRIGFGGGYYDRYLENKKNKPVCIGLAFETQKILPIKKEPWDISMDIIITEANIYSINV